MADVPSKKGDDSAEKAYAAASAEAKPKPVAIKSEPKPAVKAAKAQPAKKPGRKPASRKAAVQKPLAPKAPISSPAPVSSPVQSRVASAPKTKVVARTPASPRAEPKPATVAPAAQAVKTAQNIPSIQTQSKEIPMASKANNDFVNTINSAVSEIQTRAKTAYDKSSEVMSEVSELTKGNVEALVESGRIFAGGVQDISKTNIEEAKSAYEQMTADLKEMASVKSPTELFQLQGKIMRRNFDVLVATGSKNTEAVMKLANESFAPISGRVNLAAEKLAKAG